MQKAHNMLVKALQNVLMKTTFWISIVVRPKKNVSAKNEENKTTEKLFFFIDKKKVNSNG